VPLIDNESNFGFIWVAATVPHDDVTPEAVNLVWVLASHAAVAILNCLHRRQMEEKINELRLLTSINALKGEILRQGAALEAGGGAPRKEPPAAAAADPADPAGNGPMEGRLPIFYAELLKLLSRELKLEGGRLLLTQAIRAAADEGSHRSSAGPAAGGRAAPIALIPPHPDLGGPGFLGHPELRKLLRLADREQVRLEAGDFFSTTYPAVARQLGSGGVAVLSLAPPEARAMPAEDPDASHARGAWLLIPLAADDLERIPMLQGLLLAVVSQARMVAENMGLYDSLLYANRNLTSLQWQLVHSGKMAALGQLAGGVAHEINNPLQIMLGRVQMVQMMAENPKAVPRARIKEEIGLVSEEILRIRDIVRNLLDFSRQGKREASFAPVSLNDTLKDVLALLEHQLRSAQVEVRLHLAPEPPRVLGNRNQLKQVFMNLLMNAMHAMVRAPKVLEVRTRVHEGMAQASIRDSGIGISKENLSRIFEPFFSTKSMGTGLGLSISYGLVKDHKGTMEVESQEDRGTCFVVSIPRLAEDGLGYNLLVG
jgi:signal transduction histidine kinase